MCGLLGYELGQAVGAGTRVQSTGKTVWLGKASDRLCWPGGIGPSLEAVPLAEASVLISKVSFAQYFASHLGLCGFFRTNTVGCDGYVRWGHMENSLTWSSSALVRGPWFTQIGVIRVALWLWVQRTNSSLIFGPLSLTIGS